MGVSIITAQQWALTEWIDMDNLGYIALGVLLLVVLAVVIGKLIKGNRSEEEQAMEDNEQSVYLRAKARANSKSVDEATSPVIERKAAPVVPHGSRRVVSSTPGLAGNGPLKSTTDNGTAYASGGVLGYGLGYDNDLDGVPNSVDHVYGEADQAEAERLDLTEYDTPSEAVTVTEPAHVVEDAVVVSEPTPAYTPEPYVAPSYTPEPYSAPSYDSGSSSSYSSSSYDSGSSSSYDSGSSSSYDSGSSSF